MINSKINKTTDVCPVTRMNMRKCAVCMLLLTFFYLPAMASFPSLSEVYTWRNLSIGGGGYMTGIKIHPQNADLIYLRTDVGGCYRYDKEKQKLVQLITSVPYEECNLYGINVIAVERGHQTQVDFSPQFKFAMGDIVTVIGKVEQIEAFEQEIRS